MTEKPVRFLKKESNAIMMRSLTSGVSGLKAFQTAMDVIGNNIANVNTYGFRPSNTLFTDTLYQTLQAASASNNTTGAGGSDPMQVGYGSSAAAIQQAAGSGGFTSTGGPMDAYISGEGYFVVSTGKTATSGLEYTRVGSMEFDSSGYLTINGKRVVGSNTADSGAIAKGSTPPALSADGSNLQYIHYDTGANTLKNIALGKDGTITATNASGDVVTIGQVALAHFVNPSGLTQEGDPCTLPPTTPVPQRITPPAAARRVR